MELTKQRVKQYEAQQAESYKATINHEMRTPIETVKIVLADAICILSQSKGRLSNNLRRQVRDSLRTSMSQLTFVASFIEDLLGVNMLNHGVFNLTNKPFSPTSAIKFVLDLFTPQM